jgi:hypothetical protein
MDSFAEGSAGIREGVGEVGVVVGLVVAGLVVVGGGAGGGCRVYAHLSLLLRMFPLGSSLNQRKVGALKTPRPFAQRGRRSPSRSGLSAPPP